MASALFETAQWAWRAIFCGGAANGLSSAQNRSESPAARPPPNPLTSSSSNFHAYYYNRDNDAPQHHSGPSFSLSSAAVPDAFADALRRWDFASDASLSHSPETVPISAEDIRQRVLGAALSQWEVPLEVRGNENEEEEKEEEKEKEEEEERSAAEEGAWAAERKVFCVAPITHSAARSERDRSRTQNFFLSPDAPQRHISPFSDSATRRDCNVSRSGKTVREEEAWKLARRIREVSAILQRSGTNASAEDEEQRYKFTVERSDDDKREMEAKHKTSEDEEASALYGGGGVLSLSRLLLHDSSAAAAATAAADRRVRDLYDLIISNFCHRVVSAAASRCFSRLRGAATRALDRFTFSRVRALVAAKDIGAFPPRGIAQHVRDGIPAEIRALRADAAESFGENEKFGENANAALRLRSGETLTRAELATLRAGAWLSDQIVNAYLSLLCSDAAGREKRKTGEKESAVSLGTHFYARVEQELSAFAESADALPPLLLNCGALRWLRRRKTILYRSGGTRVVLVPINLSQNHWTLAVLDWERRAWIYYDSNITGRAAVARGRNVLRKLAHVFDEARRLLIDAPPHTAQHSETAKQQQQPQQQQSICESELRNETRATECRLVVAAPAEEVGAKGINAWEADSELGGVAVAPQQRNSYDCGVFVCYAAWCAVHGVALDFTQADVTVMRRVILQELLCQRILPRYPFCAFTKETVLHE